MTKVILDSSCFVHPQALCESERIGDGTRIWPFAHVMNGVVVGAECNIGGQAFIESGAVIGDRVTIKNQVMIWDGVTVEDDVFLGPGVIFTNDANPRSPRMKQVVERYSQNRKWLKATTVRRGASVGAGAIIRCGITIGSFAMVAAGALVTKDVADFALVTGQPARPSGWVCVCGRRLQEDLICAGCRACFKLDGGRLKAMADAETVEACGR